eukprot:TRINITY_DN8855_c0_g1_i1.p1 TRINITY_DN8855_c0_g1~~TRINITY_DN8855_c0_g1_i1.p1  ORF type:complete len:951 (+),score=286.04 TRINITY_DN8855_c0_g1_i1:50-2902(+)
MQSGKGTRVIDKYQVGEPIGKGGFGHVFKAIHIESGETVAIKSISLENIPKDQLGAIMMEIELLQKLQHKNIVKYITFFKTKEFFHIVLEYVENGSLTSIIKKMGTFPESLVVRYIAQVLEGLVYLHEQGVIHRDIKGANILTSKDGVVKLADFGVATKLADAGDVTMDVVGTPYWMAPEVIEMSGVGPASDIWSVGCTIVELIAGNPPYFELDPMPALFRIVQDDHPPIPDGISPAGVNFLLQCFQKNPSLRVDAAELLKHPWITKYAPKPVAVPAPAPAPVVVAPPVATAPVVAPAAKGIIKRNAEPVQVHIDEDSDPFGDSDEEISVSDVAVAKKPSSLKLRDYAEPDDDDFDMDDDFARKLVRKQSQHAKLQGWDDDDGSFDIDDSNLADKLNQRLKQQWDDSGVEEAFAPDDMEDNTAVTVMADAAKSQEIYNLIMTLQPDAAVSVALQSCARLVEIFRENPAQKSHLVTHHGVIPVMEMLEVGSPEVLHAVLQVVNQIIEDNVALQENLCLVGIIPAILKFAGPDSSLDIRIQAALFVQQMCFSSTLTLQMFIACRGLPALTGFLEPDFRNNRELVVMAIKGIDRVFKLQSPTPRNDFCRLFAKSKLLPRLIRAMLNVNKDPECREMTDTIAGIFLFFAQADSAVKSAAASAEVLKGIMDILDDLRDMPVVLVKMLKVIKFLTMDAMTLDGLQQAGAIPKLVGILNVKDGQSISDMHNQVLNALFNLCKLNRPRQEQAATAGIVPHLKAIIIQKSPLKQLALPMLCDLVHKSKARRELTKADGVQFYIDLLQQDYWGVTALEALSVWVGFDADRKLDKVEKIMSTPANIQKLTKVFESEQNRFLGLLTAFENIVTHSDQVNRQLGSSGFVAVLLDRLQRESIAATRLYLLKILLALYEKHQQPKQMIAAFDLYRVLRRFKDDKVLMARDLAQKMLDAFDSAEIV